MANDARSSRKSKDDEINNSKKKPAVGKGSSTSGSATTETSGRRRSNRETPAKVQMSSSPPTTRKSERLTPAKRKLELVEKHKTVSPLRRSDRGKKQQSSSSSGSKKSDKGSGSSDDRGKKLKEEKSVKQFEQEAQDISSSKNHDKKTTGLKKKKKKRMDARTYKSLFKEQRKRYSSPEFNKELEKPLKLSQGEESCVGVSKQGGDEEDGSHEVTESRSKELGEEDIDKNCEGVSNGSHLLEKNSNAEELEASCSGEKHSCGDISHLHVELECTNASENVQRFKDTAVEKLQDPDLVGSKCIERLLDDGINQGTSGTSASNGNTYPDGMDCAPITVNKDMSTSDTDTTVRMSSRCKRDDFVTTCVACNKRRRVDYKSVQQELCFCGSTMDKPLHSVSSPKDRSDNQSSVRDLVDKDECDAGMASPPPNVICVVCNLDGKLLRCGGKGCKRSFHISCLNPPLDDISPGEFHCVMCAKKKIESGVYSVTKGVESIWDTREVEVRDTEGLQKQKQYFVKYRGLAHIYNHWVPEAQLLLEAPNLVSEFNRKKQVMEWREEWMVPQRLLKRRSLRCFGDQNDHNNNNQFEIDCHYEWLVKWCGLDYEHATWEMENADFLSSSQGRRLVKEFLSRRERAKKAASFSLVDKSNKGSLVKPTELPEGTSNLYNYDHVNKLHEHWHKGENAIVINDQERVAKVILFLLSLVPDVCQPFLVITSSSALSLWEAEFARLAPSADVVVYTGNEESRKIIRAFEFYEEGGRIMLQVLLTSVEAIVKDLDDLECVRWEAVVVDECQHSVVSEKFEQIKKLSSAVRVLLFNDQLKDSMAEHLNLLCLLDSVSYLDCGSAPRSHLKSDMRKLSEKLSHFIAYDCSSDSSRFLEYWVPVLISNVQLEQYCATLLSNHTCLRSHLKNDLVEALHGILISTRKCCDHPFILDGKLQELMLEGLPLAEYLDVGIKASGKLELLDKILSKMRSQGLRAVIIFQSIGGSARDTMGDILDDFVRQRFGEDSYERLDGGYLPTKKKQVALNKFNDKKSGRFVFLLENRACQSSVKLSSVDAIIIYDSDWNPVNDLRALHKLSISSSSEKIKVFRLYTSCTVEERLLDLATHDVTLDSNLHGVGPSTCHMLLMWGASYLFSKLHKFHGGDTCSTSSRTSDELSLQNDIAEEFLALLCKEGKNVYTDNSLIIKVRKVGTKYSKTASLFGEHKVQLVEKEDPRLFWTNLLEGRNPRWRYPSGLSQRNRKRVKNFDEFPNKLDVDAEELRKKRMKLGNNGADPASLGPSSVEGGKEGDSEARVNNDGSQISPRSSAGVTHPNNASRSHLNSNGKSSLREANTGNSLDGLVLRDVQKNLHGVLKPEISKLCAILQLPEDFKVMIGRFLEYVVDNHHVSREPASIFQAFQISLCWIAASLLKYAMDKKDSFALVKQNLNFDCTEEEARNVYSKLRHLKRPFLSHVENLKESESSKDSISLADDILMEQLDAKKLPLNSPTIKVEVEERSENQDVGDERLLQQQVLRQAGKPEVRMTKLIQKQQEELQVFQRTWEKEREELEKDRIVGVDLIHRLYKNIPARMDKLKKLNEKFSKKAEELETRKVLCLKELEAKQLAERREERQKPAPRSEALQAGAIREVQPHMPLAAASEALSHGATLVSRTTSLDPNHATNALHSTALSSVRLAGSENISDLQCSSGAPRKKNYMNQLPSAVQDSDTASLREKEFPGSSLKEVVDSSDPRGVVNSNFESNKELNHQDDVFASSRNGGSLCIDNPLVQSSMMQPRTTSAEADTTPQKVDKVLPSLASRVRGEEELAGENQNVLQDFEGQSLSPAISERADQTNHEAVGTENEDRPASGSQNVRQQVELEASHRADSGPTNQTNHDVGVTEHVEKVPLSASDNQNRLDPQTILTQQSEDTENLTTPPLPVPATDLHVIHNQPDVDLSARNDSQPSNEGSASSQNAEGFPQMVENTDMLPENQSNLLHSIHATDVSAVPSQQGVALAERIGNQPHGEGFTSFLATQGSQLLAEDLARLPNQGISGTQVGIHPANNGEFGMNFALQSSRHTTPLVAAQPVYDDPLQNELERLRKETDQVIKIHRDTKLQLQSECEKEIENMIAEIRRKYETKLQVTEASFMLKKKELDMSHDQVLMNKTLADAFKSKFLDIRPSGGLGMQQVLPSNFMLQMHMLPPHAAPGRPSPGSALPSVVANHVGHQTISSTPAHYPSAHVSSMPSRPFHNVPANPPAGNRQLTSEIRSPAPHLQQRFRPPPSMGAVSSPPIPWGFPIQQQVHQNFPRTPLAPNPDAAARRYGHQAMSGLIGDVQNQSGTLAPNNTAEFVPNFGSVHLTQFGSTPDTQGGPGSAADIVCLSDDE